MIANDDKFKKYLIWDDKSVPKTYDVEELLEFKGVASHEFSKDKPLAERWSPNATCEVINGDPKNPAFADNLIKTSYSQLIISERLKSALEEQNVSGIEYLPVKLKDGKKIFPVKYYFAHLINLPDCLDLEKSGAKMSRIIKTNVDSIMSLVFKQDPGRALFRPSNYTKATLISWELAEALSKTGFSGLSFYPLFDHPKTDESKKKNPIHKEIAVLNSQNEKAKPITVTSVKEKPKSRMKMPKDEIQKWIKSLGEHPMIKGQKFVPMPGEDLWLESYEDNADSWPAFDPKQYYCLGSNNQSDYWLLDLETGAVVYYTHELGYNRTNFGKVEATLEKFKKLVRLK